MTTPHDERDPDRLICGRCGDDLLLSEIVGHLASEGRLIPPEPDERDATIGMLREALAETYGHITTYEDAMGHGYCASQSGEIEDGCTCGYEAKRERWNCALTNTESAARAYRERVEKPWREFAATVEWNLRNHPDVTIRYLADKAASLNTPANSERNDGRTE